MKTIKLVWLDGKIERVDVEDYRREEGVLVLTLRRLHYRYIPFTSLLEWSVE